MGGFRMVATSMFATAAAAGCGGGTEPAPAPPAVASVVVSPGSASVEVGASIPLTATSRSASGSDLPGRAISWTSSSPVIASVSGSGAVTGLTDGSGHCWGTNFEGQLGDGTRVNRNDPGPIADGHVFTVVDAGDHHTCGITTAGPAYCWGRHTSSQLGIDLSMGVTGLFLRPTRVQTP